MMERKGNKVPTKAILLKICLGVSVLLMAILLINEVKAWLSQREIASAVGIPEQASRLEVINTVRGFVYRNAGNNPMPPSDARGDALYSLAAQKKLPRDCGQMAITYQWILDQLGIPNHTVYLYADSYIVGDNIFDSHYTVEVELEKGRFIASDPTFNASFRCGDIASPASYQELYECASKGGKIVPLLGVQLPQMGIDDYYLPYHKLLAGVLVFDKASRVIGEFPQGLRSNLDQIKRKK